MTWISDATVIPVMKNPEFRSPLSLVMRQNCARKLQLCDIGLKVCVFLIIWVSASVWPPMMHYYSTLKYFDRPVCLCICLSVCVSVLSASISLEPLDRSARNFLCRSPVAMARSSSNIVALCYVLPVLWMTSYLAVMGATPKGGGCTQ